MATGDVTAEHDVGSNGGWSRPLVRARTAREAVQPEPGIGTPPGLPPEWPTTLREPDLVAAVHSDEEEPATDQFEAETQGPVDDGWALVSRDELFQVEERLTAVARAAGRQEQALAELAGRLDHVEQRLGCLEEGAAPGEAPPVPPVPPPTEGLEDCRRDVKTLSDLLVDVDERISQLESAPTGLEERIAGLEGVPVDIDERAAEVFQRFALEYLPLSGDMEGLHRELDTILGMVAGRDATMVEHLDRVVAVEEAFTKARDELERLAADIAARPDEAAGAVEAAVRELRDLQQRVEGLESPEADIERVCRGLNRLMNPARSEGSRRSDH